VRRCTVCSHSRLHLGFLDLHGGLGRLFGSIGVGLESPCMNLEAVESPVLEAGGDDSDRTRSFAEKFYQRTGIPEETRSRLLLRSGLPPHAGLGSGTQLALTVGKALSILHDMPLTTREIASMMGRGRRSGAGIALFDDGGLVIDGGKKTDGNDELPPLLYRRRIPENWFCVVAIPGRGFQGPSWAIPRGFGSHMQGDADEASSRAGGRGPGGLRGSGYLDPENGG